MIALKKILFVLTFGIFLSFFSLTAFAKPDNTGKPSMLIEPQNNKLKVTSIDEDGEEGEPETEEEVEVEIEDNDESSDTETTLKASGNAAVVIKDNLSAQTNFPLRVNTTTNELTVITPKGEKIVTILPDKAVQNMLASKVLDEVAGKGGYLYNLENPTATSSAEPSPTGTQSGEPVQDSEIELVLNENDVLVYRIKGKEVRKLFRLFDIKINKTIIVSAENGDILDIEQNFLSNLLETFSS